MAEPSARARIFPYAAFTLVAAFLLIVAGGLVTSRDAGLAVPDWPLAFGQINPPGWWRIENIRSEHGHRIIAFFVACSTALLAWRIHRFEDRRWVRRLGVVAAGLVLFQALLGGLRVLELSLDLAMVHGWIAQIFFSVLVVLATVTASSWRLQEDSGFARLGEGAERIAYALVAIVVVQLAVGILIRHLGAAVRPLLNDGWFYLHVFLGLLIAWFAYRLASLLPPEASPRRALQAAHALPALIAGQILLGLGSYAVTDRMAYDRQATAVESWVPTLHVTLGAAVLGAALVVATYAWAGRRQRGAVPSSAGERLVEAHR